MRSFPHSMPGLTRPVTHRPRTCLPASFRRVTFPAAAWCWSAQLSSAGHAGSAHVAGVSEGEATGLGPEAESVRSASHADLVLEPSGGGVEDVDHAVAAPGEPELAAVGRNAAHVR